MGPSAYVTEINTLIEFQAALCTFGDKAKDALGMIDMEIQRTFSWLEEQIKHWAAAVRHAEDGLIEARTELERRRMMRIGEQRLDTSDQEKALLRAKQRLEFCQEKLTACKRWLRDLPEELKEYEGPSRQLQGILDAEVPRMTAYMQQKIVALEAYLNNPPV